MRSLSDYDYQEDELFQKIMNAIPRMERDLRDV
jgi:hypothetical protein